MNKQGSESQLADLRYRAGWEVLRESYGSFFRHLGPLKAGSIAFFATLSLFPLALLAVSVVGHAIGSQQASDEVAVLVQQYLPGASEQVVRALKQTAGRHLLVDIAGTLALLWSAMNLFTTFSQVLTVVWWGEPTRPSQRSGFAASQSRRRGYLRHKLVSFVAVIAACALFFASVVLTGLLAAVGSYAHAIGALANLHQRLHFLDSAVAWTLHTAVVASMLFLLYWTMPAGRVSAKAAAAAAVPAGLLWVASRSVFAMLVKGSSRYQGLYGPLAGGVILLIWIYYSAYIMIFCGEIGSALQARYWPANGRRSRAS
jgi:membrane protein